MTLRPEYSLGHSAYNDFLHAPLGHDAAGTELTVLSALARLGLDPWAEAARLADLPRGAAARALADVISRLPAAGLGGSWTESQAAAVAERLVVSLPQGRVPDVPPTEEVAAAASPAARSSSSSSSSSPSAGSAPPPDRRAAAGRPPPRRGGLSTWLLWGAIAVGFYFLLVQMAPNRHFESRPELSGRTVQQ